MPALRSQAGMIELSEQAADLSPAGQMQVVTALEMLAVLDGQLTQVRRELLGAARHLKGARVLTGQLYGVGPITALALCCWLAGADRFSSSRKAVRFAGLDITVHSSDGKRSPGHLSRQGPSVLRRCLYEAGKTHARSRAPDHSYYAQVKDRIDGKRAALSEARKIVRQACQLLGELGDDARPGVIGNKTPGDSDDRGSAGWASTGQAKTNVTDGDQCGRLPPTGCQLAEQALPGRVLQRPPKNERPQPPPAGGTQSIILSPGPTWPADLGKPGLVAFRPLCRRRVKTDPLTSPEI